MKYLIFIFFTVLLSCNKDWECCVDTTVAGHPQGTVLYQFNGTTTHCNTFRGDKKEKDKFEELGNTVYTHHTHGLDTSYYYTISQITECH